MAAAGGLVRRLRRQGVHVVGHGRKRRGEYESHARSGARRPALPGPRLPGRLRIRCCERRRLLQPCWVLGSEPFVPTKTEMADRLPSFLPRVAALVLVALGATAGLTYAAGSQLPSSPAV